MFSILGTRDGSIFFISWANLSQINARSSSVGIGGLFCVVVCKEWDGWVFLYYVVAFLFKVLLEMLTDCWYGVL